jgi:BolA protein
MRMQDQIEKAISGVITIESIEIINESHRHAGHVGDNGTGESHFRATIVSPDFEKMSRVQRQKIVMDAVKPLFSKGLHAFSLKANAP